MKLAYALVLCVLAMTAGCIHTKVGPINMNRTVEIDITNHVSPSTHLDVYIVDNVGHWHLGEVKTGGTMRFNYQPTTPENLYHLWAKSSASHDVNIMSVDFTLVGVESIDWDVRGNGNDMVRFH